MQRYRYGRDAHAERSADQRCRRLPLALPNNVLTHISWDCLPKSTLGPPEQSLNTIALRTGVLALARIGLIAVLGVVDGSLHPQ